jgi:hypothetical protein
MLNATVGLSNVPVVAECVVDGPERVFDDATAVFLGRAVSQSIVRSTLPSGRATETTFAVRQVWKGPTEVTLRVQTCGWADNNTMGGWCGDSAQFTIGSQYLVFASGNPLVSVGCESLPASSGNSFLKWLASKPSTVVAPR